MSDYIQRPGYRKIASMRTGGRYDRVVMDDLRLRAIGIMQRCIDDPQGRTERIRDGGGGLGLD